MDLYFWLSPSDANAKLGLAFGFKSVSHSLQDSALQFGFKPIYNGNYIFVGRGVGVFFKIKSCSHQVSLPTDSPKDMTLDIGIHFSEDAWRAEWRPLKDFPRKCNRIFGIFSLAHCIINTWNSLKQEVREAKVSSMWTVRTFVAVNSQSSPKRSYSSVTGWQESGRGFPRGSRSPSCGTGLWSS